MASKKTVNKRKKGTTKRKGNKQQATETNILKSSLFIHGLIWSVIFVFTALFMYIDTNAVLAEAAQKMLGGLFGVMAYMIPVIFCGTLIYLVYF